MGNQQKTERNIRPRAALVIKTEQREARCFVLAGTISNQKSATTPRSGEINRNCERTTLSQQHASFRQSSWSRRVDSPESVNLIGKTNVLGTAIVFDVTEG